MARGTPEVAFVQQYQNTITMLAQQMDNRLRQTVMVDTDWTGEAKYYDQYGSDSMEEIMTRYADTPVQTPDHERRRVTPRFFVSNTLEDPQDALAMLVDPKSTYMQAKMASAARKTDLIIIQAASAAALAGKAGGTSTALPSTSKIAVGGAGLTKAKLIEASKKLNANEVEKEDRHIVISAEQLEDLLNTTEVTSSDFNTVKALVEGTLDTWLGFKFVHSEQLETDASDSRLVLAYQKKGIQLAIQNEAEGRIDPRPDKNYAWQVYLKIVLGAVRLEEERVIQIACSE